ncbi:MAG: molybdopterin-dependent oxidoreductase [Acidimicrobiales bacterium]
MTVEMVAEQSTPSPDHLAAEPWRGPVSGAVAAAVALGFAELVASFGTAFPSLVVGVGGWLIDRSPGDVTRAAIDALGTNNKPVLVTTIVVATVALGAVVGAVATTRRWLGIVAFAVVGGLGALAAAGEPGASTAGALTVAVLASGIGIATLLLLLVVADGRLPVDPRQIESPTDPFASRRAFLGFAGAATAFAGLTAGGARLVAGRSPVEAARDDLVLPSAATPAPVSVGAEIEGVDGLSPLYTPNDQFFRIDTALTVPQVDPDTWSLTIDGLVDEPLTFSFDDIAAMPLVEADVTLSCVSNQVGGSLVGNARWLGVPLLTLLDRAGVRPDAEQVVGRSVDGFTAGFPLAALSEDRSALVAIGMNGEPLPVRHGFPARLVVSGLYGYVSATKWLERIELTTWAGFDGYWIPRGWSKEGPVHTQSRIDVPGTGDSVAAGATPIAGVAWAPGPGRGVTTVEVQIDDGPWVEADMSDPIGDDAWRQWVYSWDATPGRHRIRSRATDGTGEVQTEVERPPAPSGATGWHEVNVGVS